MEKETYLADPCGASSLPLWKTNRIPTLPSMLILREDDPRLDDLDGAYGDTRYFKLLHPLAHVLRPALPDGFCFVRPNETELSQHIAACYEAEGISPSALAACRLHGTYAPDLWLGVAEEGTRAMVASGIAELDRDIREGVLEWIQVSPAYRRRGFGRIVVCELLHRLQGRADFVTVSGKADDPSCPRALYERCGFGGGVIWHVLRKG